MSSHATDRNLLAGMLALQMEFINQQQLISALHAWMLQKSQGIEAILRAQGAISGEVEDFLASIIKKYAEKSGDDLTKAIADLSNPSSLEASLMSIDPSLDRTLQSVRDQRRRNANTEATFVHQSANDGSISTVRRFRVIRPHAKGGLGQVSVAADLELNREVALKEMQQTFWGDAASKQRFLVEAEITGRLEHPGIVPVYSLGTTAKGLPFYVMRFIQGRSLKDELVSFHQSPANSDVDGYRTGLRKLLRRLVDVCNAMEYAHSRGVLHRDLKPSNIMLGKYGETLVVDWGLAKSVGKSERYQNTEEPTVVPSSSDDSNETRQGLAVGTLAYMSPEQAEGRHEVLGPATDVYCLGGTLYSILTGKTPIDPGSSEGMMQAIRRGAIKPPREIRHDIPVALEAICMKALRLKPKDRYESASLLAADIENWLADEPVNAYREPMTVRAQRWIRKHREIATAVGVAVLALCLSLSVIAVLISSQNRSLKLARDREAEARRLAESAERDAIEQKNRLMQLTDTTMNVAENYLGEVRGANSFRDKLLSDSYVTYRQMHLQFPDSRDYLVSTFKSARLSGMQKGRLGNAKEGIERLRESIVLQEGEQADRPSEEGKDYLGGTYRDLGTLLKQEARFTEALSALDKARQIHRVMQEEDPSNINYLRSLAMVDFAAAGAYLEQVEVDNALLSARRAAAALVRICEEPKIQKTDPFLAVGALNTVGRALIAKGDLSAVFKHYQESLPVCETLIKKIPGGIDAKVSLARFLGTAAEGLAAKGSDDETVITWCDRSIDLWTELIAGPEVNLSYVSQSGEAYRARALLHARLREFEQADGMFEKAIECGTKAASKIPLYEFKYQFGLTYARQAEYFKQKEDMDSSNESLRKAREWLEQALAQAPEAKVIQLAIDALDPLGK